MKRETGAFICFIGIDGSGKTTHAIVLTEALAKRHLNSVYVRPRYELFKLLPPGIGKWIRRYFHIRPALATGLESLIQGDSESARKHENEIRIGKALMSYLLLIYALISYQLAIGRYSKKSYVVCDRYFFDWFLSEDKTRSLAMARKLPKPDLAFFMDIPVPLAYGRMNSDEDRHTAPNYFESLRAWYMLLAKTEGFATIDSSEDFEKTKNLILEKTITNLLLDGGKH